MMADIGQGADFGLGSSKQSSWPKKLVLVNRDDLGARRHQFSTFRRHIQRVSAGTDA
jgi:hypothetical protein